ncbi:MAG: PAS domain S-box protein [Bacteroidetes bacterium]|nr:PAS domain S-box protein [Bacteroidota bacterium]
MGWYSKEELETVTPKRIQRFFTRSEGGFRIAKMVRDICVFAQHNILQDPPFSRLDFISCRNLFIYLDTPAQRRATTTFHYALKEKGYLMLGKSEAITSSTQLFAPYNAKFKVFLRKNSVGEYSLPFISGNPATALLKEEPGSNGTIGVKGASKKRIQISNHDLDKAIDEVLVADFMPASVVINHQMEILQFRGSTDLYLTHAPGKATFSILKMARLGINFALRHAIAKVIKTNHRERKEGIEVNVKDKTRVVSFEVVPLKITWEEPLLLIIFSEQEQVAAVSISGNSSKRSALLKDKRIKKLEEELTIAHADALAFSQEQEAFIEELQSANEEIVSSNEELQTVNEELETSKEEIESTNEELTTSNQELQTRNDLLNESYEYSKAIISTLHEPMIVMDRNLRVKTANKSFYKAFGVKEEETEGILLYDLGNGQWNIPRLRELMEDIVPKNNFFYDFEVRHVFPVIGEKVLQLNANKVFQKSIGEELILLSINDITDLVMLQEKDKEVLKKDIQESKKSNRALEKAVKERTMELRLANSVLAEKNIELEKMNNELQAFTFVSSHDLQEPLRKIQTFADRILETENKNLTDSGKNYFRYLQTSAERMQALILDLLTFSRINATDRKFKNTQLSKLVDEVLVDLQEQIEEHKAVIELNENCEVYIIPFLFRQVLHNLLTNALKFSKKNIPQHIVIQCQKVHSGEVVELHSLSQGNYSHISISDNGIGFKNEFREKIFEVFQKLHSKDEYAGTGIGLAIVKKIIENHNGVIFATSEINKGSTFDIYIPVK